MNEEMSKDLYERAVKHMPGGVKQSCQGIQGS